MKIGFIDVDISEKDMLKMKEWSRRRIYIIGIILGMALGINLCLIILYLLGDPFLSWFGGGVLG